MSDVAPLTPQLADQVREVFQLPSERAEFEPFAHSLRNGVTGV
ncbi:hypothetical protein AB0I27_20765 [Streptomyces sp. NPDC050597]